MKLPLSEAQVEALLEADFLPDVLRDALQRAEDAPDGKNLELSLEEATALEELCSWNVKSGSDGEVTPETRVFDQVVRAIITHPDY